MATVNPYTFFSFAASHHRLLIELYYKREGLAEPELMTLIRRNSDPEASAGAVYIRDRLVELGVLEHSPLADAEYEMTRPVAALMGQLLQQYRLTSVAVIQSYFTAIDGYAADMADAVDSGNSDLLVRVNGELEDHVERMRHDSRNNREKVVADVIRIKTNRERISPQQRYIVINRLWNKYIIPLRDIIDTQKVMDEVLERLLKIYDSAAEQFAADGVVMRVVGSGAARLRRLQRDVLNDFQETIREVTPLYEELRRETSIARGASQCLDMIRSRGLRHLHLSRQIGLSNWQRRGLFSDDALEAYIYGMHGYAPQPPAALNPGEPGVAAAYVDIAEFENKVAGALPIEDAFEWLLDSYPDISALQILKLYGRLHSGDYGKTSFMDEMHSYGCGNLLFTATAMRVEKSE